MHMALFGGLFVPLLLNLSFVQKKKYFFGSLIVGLILVFNLFQIINSNPERFIIYLDVLKLVMFLTYLKFADAKLNLSLNFFKILQFYTILTFIMSILQIAFPNLSLWILFAENIGQYQGLKSYPFGIVGHRSAQSFIIMFIALICLANRKIWYFWLSVGTMALLGNKTALIGLAFGTCYLTFTDIRMSFFRKLVFLSLVISLSGFSLLNFSESLIILYNEGRISQAHTISHRMTFIYEIVNFQLSDLIFPKLNKDSWTTAFDSQVVLLIFRYGLLVTASMYLLIFYYGGRFISTKIFITILSVMSSLTIISHYHALHFVTYAFLTIALSKSVEARSLLATTKLLK